jgi:N-acetylglucosaminyldiphosphoundecaprenol N-acetyl-beta-D-mannosaminyltransferase
MSSSVSQLPKRRVLTVDISVGSFTEHVEAIAQAAQAHRSSYVCCVNAHMTVECRDPGFAAVVNAADLATADGMPVLKVLQWFHKVKQQRVAGNDLLPALLERAASQGLSVFLYGGSEDTLQKIRDRAAREWPTLHFAGSHAPPFGPLSGLDMDAEAARINAAGAQIVMVSLGCPKQERWMAAMKGRVNGVMLGLGGAFLLYAGVDNRAPRWMRDLSLEWLYRFMLEPRRLWRRYLVTNTQFLVLLAAEVFRRLFDKRQADVK